MSNVMDKALDTVGKLSPQYNASPKSAMEKFHRQIVSEIMRSGFETWEGNKLMELTDILNNELQTFDARLAVIEQKLGL